MKNMASSFVYKTFKIRDNAETVRERITELLTDNGYKVTGESGTVRFFSYPKLRFSSKRPLTCISRLSLDVKVRNNGTSVQIGVTFTKIRYFTILMILTICVLFPLTAGIVKNGIPDIPPMAYMGIPLGLMLHFHVRGRVFRALKKLVENVEEK